MKYFFTDAQRAGSGCEDCIEFQKYNAKEEYFDTESLYLSNHDFEEFGFGAFWSNCLRKYDFFDMDTIQAEDWRLMAADAKVLGGCVWEVVEEIGPWIEAQFEAGAPYIPVVDEFNRALDRRREAREKYVLAPEFYDEVKKLAGLPFDEQQTEYEKLLDKFNMPFFFYPISLNSPVVTPTETEKITELLKEDRQHD